MNDEIPTTMTKTGNHDAHAALTALPDPVVITDRAGLVTYLNPAAATLLGLQHDDPVGQPLHSIMLLVDEENGTAWDPLHACFELAGETDRSDLLLSHDRPNCDIPVQVSVIAVKDGDDRCAMLYIRDITDLKAQVKALSDAAQLDPLTQLPNRNLFIDRLGQAMMQATRDDRLVAVLFLDLDNFKGVNDTYGHEAGDMLLKAVANRLKACVRSGDSVGRYAGDEFTLLLANLHQVEDAIRVVTKVQKALARPIRIKNAELPINASIGLSIYPNDGEREDLLLSAADGAMYRAKQQGKNCARFVSSEDNRMLPNQAMDEEQLRTAFDQSQFQLYFQPRWDAIDDRIVSVEALLRWQHPEQGIIPASEFLRLTEQTGLIQALANWALKEACERASEWRRAGLPMVPINVNLSAYQFRQQDLAGIVGEAMDCFEMPAESLQLEVSEETLRDHGQLVIPVLHQIHELGANICIANFGSGGFSWRDLKHLPSHRLQLGQTLVQAIGADKVDSAAAHAALAFASELKRPISAAGVETRQQRDFLLQRGCRVMQGYLFGLPIPPDAIGKMLGEADEDRAVA